MSVLDLDRYYTPAAVARRIVDACDVDYVASCLDPACGGGSLLNAAQGQHRHAVCVGMDVDGSTIARLRRERPDWILSRGDALDATAWRRSAAGLRAGGCDLALLNPPFSMAAQKGLVVRIASFRGRCSVAMAHLLTAIERAKPRVCGAIVPESLMFAQRDEGARQHLAARYEIALVEGLRSSTFRGGRANSLVLRFRRRSEVTPVASGGRVEHLDTRLKIVRGGLPEHEAVERVSGIPYVHTTDLPALDRRDSGEPARRVDPIGRGIIGGYAILLPRVGLPGACRGKLLRLAERVQLSDCVIGIRFVSRRDGLEFEKALKQRWVSLVALYRGTGARYITVEKLRGWLAQWHGRAELGSGAPSLRMRRTSADV